MKTVKTSLRQLLYSTLWVIGLGTGASMQAPQAEARTNYQQLADEACREALETNTIDALEDFLMKFPDATTACRAKAMSKLNEFSNKGQDVGGKGNRNGGGYGGI